MRDGRWTMAMLLAATIGGGACTDHEPPVPGLEEPGCAMTWRAYAVTAVDEPRLSQEVDAYSLDVDQRRGDSSVADNMIGKAVASMYGVYPETWDSSAAATQALASGTVPWVIEVGTCADGDEVRVTSARAADPDGDGVWSVVDRGVPSVGTRHDGAVTTTERGIGQVPVGTLLAGSTTAATDGWQAGLGLTTELTVDGDRLDGRLGLGLTRDTPIMLAPLCAFFNERLDGGASEFADRLDGNRDGTIDFAECRTNLVNFVSDDLDLGACDDAACYQPWAPDGVRDHASLGVVIHGTAITLE